ncbi:hypothetical protein [Ornithinibacillus californiensis]|uniref:hypothetical protein n=1 Tax=Ornithinibacillus californiensis TaxID=161536 RepID=UPI00064DA1AF|nr:hypothetical protein [Ornithinibacillus californiensis]
MIASSTAPELLQPVPITHIKFKYNDTEHSIYGYDWVRIDEYGSRVNIVTNDSFNFLHFGESLNKGTLQTLKYLVKANDNQELIAAIWLHSFIRDILEELPENLRGNSYRLLSEINNAVSKKLRDSNMTWHHSMRRLQPESYFNFVFDDLTLKGYESIVELAIIHAKLINSNYIGVLYDSYRDDKE